MEEELLPLKDRLNLETARITWSELERYFASGKVIHVAATLDLIEVATSIAEDNAAAVKQWMEAQQVDVLNDATALQWVEQQPDNLWAVVLAPWVVVEGRCKPYIFLAGLAAAFGLTVVKPRIDQSCIPPRYHLSFAAG